MLFPFLLATGCWLLPAIAGLWFAGAPRAFRFHLAGYAAATAFFAFHASAAALAPRLGHGFATLCCGFVAAALLVATVIRYLLRSPLPEPSPPSRQVLVLFGILVMAAIATDVWVLRLQGFVLEDRTSRFAAPFAGDHWRHASIIAGFLRGSESVFFPNSELVYQILWHRGAATAIGVLPHAASVFPQALGISLATALLFYVLAFWIVVAARGSGKPVSAGILILFAFLIGTDADIFNAIRSRIQISEWAIALNYPGIQTVLRYFSAKLLSLTAPQHAAFFVLVFPMVGALLVFHASCYASSPASRPAGCYRWVVAGSGFAVAAVLFSPILSLIFLPILFGSFALRSRIKENARTILVAGGLAVLASIALHQLILGFPIWDPFLRPNLTGGGSGKYGIEFLPWVRDFSRWAPHLPLLLVELAGVSGAVLLAVVAWYAARRPSALGHPLLVAVLATAVLWNLLVVETEVQRHSTMVLSVLGAVWVALSVGAPEPRRWKRWLFAGCNLLIGLVCLLLNGILVRTYTEHAAFMPLTSSWPDYFCVNDVLRTQFPQAAVVVRTPVNFELPISSEAATSLVWSQIAAVHQRIPPQTAKTMDEVNPRDWKTFRAYGEAHGEKLLELLRTLGFNAVIWGPLEEADYGASLARLLTHPGRFVAGCGRVALYSLDEKHVRPLPDAARRHAAFLSASLSSPDPLFGFVPDTDARTTESKHTIPSSGGTNFARGRTPTQSSDNPGGLASYATDGISLPIGVPMAFTRNSFSPWWEIDLGEIRSLEFARIATLDPSPFPQYELADFYILVSDTPFRSDRLFVAGTQPGVTTYFVSGKVSRSVDVGIMRSGRYFRIQGTRQGHLVLSEVEIFGTHP